MRCALVLLALFFASATFAACPTLPDQEAPRIVSQRGYLAGLSNRPNSIFQFADCAAQWAPGALTEDTIAPELERPTWLLVKDLADVLRRGAERANSDNAKRYREAWRTMARTVLDALKGDQFRSIDLRDKRHFILYHGHNMQSLGAPGAREYIQDLEGLDPKLFGPELVDQLVRAMDSCATWDFVEGANRTTHEQKVSMCSEKCLDYAGTVVELLKPVPSVLARSSSRRFNDILGKCSAEPVRAGASPGRVP